MNEEVQNAVSEEVGTNEDNGFTQPTTNTGIDNSQFKKVREATEAKVAKKYESKMEEILSQFETYKNDFDAQLKERDEQISQLKEFTKDITKEADMSAIRGIGIPESNLEDAYNFAQLNPQDENLGDKLVKYFGGLGANPAAGTIPIKVERTDSERDSILKAYGLQ